MEKVQTGFHPPEPSVREEPSADSRESVKSLAPPASPNTSPALADVEPVASADHETRLPETPLTPRKVRRERLINKINYVNFQDGSVLVVFKHKKYSKTQYVLATPRPCVGQELAGVWRQGNQRPSLCHSHRFDHILIPDGTSLLRVDTDLLRLDDEGFAVRLPEYCLEISSRKVARHPCKGITAHLVQNSTVFAGELLDFNAVSFRVRVHAIPPQTFQWLNRDADLSVIFTDGSQTLYTGDCRILSQSGGQNSRDYVLEPIHAAIQRFKPKQYRSHRHRVVPSPDIVFQHPFTGKVVTLKVIDLSGSGFSVEEDAHTAVLLPGLMLPEVELSFANSLRFRCRAQVIYRHCDDADVQRIRCGIAILDMDIARHVQLVALLQQAENRHSYICNKVDLDALWDFFFETGFIYPHKYEFIQKNKEKIKSTYEKLYAHNPNIARHFVYQDKSRILAHMAMVRFYENTWLIHHHAARNSESSRAGLMVLKQIGSFGNDSHRLYSIHMDYLMCYYRPDNKFPRRVFGGAVRSIKDIQACSENTFGYFHFRPENGDAKLESGWELAEARDEDLSELRLFYEAESGGLMLQGLNLEPGNTQEMTLNEEYRKLGFRRDRRIFALKCSGDLRAVILSDVSDIGLNLSDLTNCIKLLVLDPRGLTRTVLQACFGQLIRLAGYKEMPVMVYPDEFLGEAGIPFEKSYNLWIINMQHTDDYFRYLNRLLQFINK